MPAIDVIVNNGTQDVVFRNAAFGDEGYTSDVHVLNMAMAIGYRRAMEKAAEINVQSDDVVARTEALAKLGDTLNKLVVPPPTDPTSMNALADEVAAYGVDLSGVYDMAYVTDNSFFPPLVTQRDYPPLVWDDTATANPPVSETAYYVRKSDGSLCTCKDVNGQPLVSLATAGAPQVTSLDKSEMSAWRAALQPQLDTLTQRSQGLQVMLQDLIAQSSNWISFVTNCMQRFERCTSEMASRL